VGVDRWLTSRRLEEGRACDTFLDRLGIFGDWRGEFSGACKVLLGDWPK
jgi:hypothetical protein